MSSFIHPTALVSPQAHLGEEVYIGPYSIIHEQVEIGDYSRIGAYCEIGLPPGGHETFSASYPLKIGAHALIRSRCTLYAGSTIGARLECGHGAIIREESLIGENLRIGSGSIIEGHCQIGNYVRLQGNVQIGKGSLVDDFVWIFPNVVLTNDPHPPSPHLVGVTLKAYAVIGTASILLPGVTIGAHAVIGALSLVKSSIPEKMLAAGHPAKVICPAHHLRDYLNPGKRAYPWPENFDRGLPWENQAFQAWLAQLQESPTPEIKQTSP